MTATLSTRIDVECKSHDGKFTLTFPKEAIGIARQLTRYNELLDEVARTRAQLIMLTFAMKNGSWIERKLAILRASMFLSGKTETVDDRDS